MVQKRNLGVEDDHDGSGSSLGGPMITINVSHALPYEVFIAAQSTFGDVKKLLMKKTGLNPEQQRLFFNGREKEDEEHLHAEGVSDKTRLLLLEGQARKEKKLEESRECDEMLNASKAVAGVRSEVDKLSEMVVTLEVAVDGGTKVSEEEFQGLTNLLMGQLMKLDTIEAQGEAKLQRKAEVLRVQNCVDTLESLKVRNNGNAVKEEKLPLQKTSLEPEEQGRFSRGKERENEEHLLMEDVNKKMKLEESRARIEMMKASEAVAAVRSEVDELSERVAALEVAADCGTEVSEKEFQMLNELLMKQLLKLDTIEACGEAKLRRKAEVLRLQKFLDTVDSLKARNSDSFSNGVKAEMEYSTGYEELHEEDPIAEKTSIDSYVSARSSSQQGEAHTEELLPNGSFPETEAASSPSVAAGAEFEFNPNQRLSSVLLNEFNYLPWSRAITLALGGRSKLSFIDDKVASPNISSPDYPSWLYKDQLVRSWILNSMDRHLAEIFRYSDSAAQLWVAVRDMYGQQNNYARIFELQRDIVKLQQSGKPFVQLLGSLKKMWNELEVYRPHTVDASILRKRVEEDKIFQLLASLGSDYEDFRSHILKSPELPSLSSEEESHECGP
ncbi:hypothetical protein L6164_002359 [Bauhinia variegata]|uniref:Uncharacterized protein n=1 Tax=Bauhinia variegata TaxID=167791 RepID=A0ACB9PXZ5_BAUVA|nr:hypothetical protein L6164_002359 [Bauhinia variegata]